MQPEWCWPSAAPAPGALLRTAHTPVVVRQWLACQLLGCPERPSPYCSGCSSSRGPKCLRRGCVGGWIHCRRRRSRMMQGLGRSCHNRTMQEMRSSCCPHCDRCKCSIGLWARRMMSRPGQLFYSGLVVHEEGGCRDVWAGDHWQCRLVEVSRRSLRLPRHDGSSVQCPIWLSGDNPNTAFFYGNAL